MFSRRPGHRFNRGRIAMAAGGGTTALDPLAIVTSVTPFFYLVGDLGATGAQWDDQSGNARHATQGTGSAQPAVAADATLNGLTTVDYDGTSDFQVLTTWDPPAPGTTNIFFWFVFKQVTWTSGDTIFGAGLSTLRLRQGGASPQLAANNTSVSGNNDGAVIDVWTRGRLLFSNSTNDYLRLAGTNVTGVNLGNTNAAAGSFQIGADTSTRFGRERIYALLATAGEPSAGELSSLDAWISERAGGVVAL